MIDEEIQNRIGTTFKVTKIPFGELKKFKELCKEEYGDIYWVGICQLMKIKERYEQMLTMFSSLQEQINKINKINSLKQTREIKTFGE